MAFLTLNGYQVPVATAQMTRSYEEAARVTRQATGQLSRDARLAKRKWEITTRPMKWDDAQLLQSMLYGPPARIWNFSTGALVGGLPASAVTSSFIQDLPYSIKIAADGSSVTHAAKFGNYAATPAYTNTNLWGTIASGNVTNGTESAVTTGFVAVGAATLETSAVAKWQGLRSLRVVTTGANQGFSVQTISVTQGVRYFISFYVRADTTPGQIVAEMVSNGTTVATRTVTTSASSWQRVTIHGVATSASNFTLRVTSPNAGAHYFDGLQLEINARTPWTQTARTLATVAVYNITAGAIGGATGISFAAWVRPTDCVDGAVFAAWYSATSARLSLRCNALSGLGEPLKLTSIETGGTVRTLTTSGFAWPQDNGWTHVIAVMRPAPYTPQLAIYINGVLNASSSPGVTWLPTSIDKLFIGNENGVYQYNAGMDNFAVYPYALDNTAAGVVYNTSNGTLPLTGDWPLMKAAGDFLPGGGTAYVYATLTGSDITQAASTTGAFGNYQSLNILLQEN